MSGDEECCMGGLMDGCLNPCEYRRQVQAASLEEPDEEQES